MSVITGFTNQTAQLQRYTGKDGFNKPTYAAAETIKVRRDGAWGKERTAVGTEIDAESEYMTEATVSVQDKVDGIPIKGVVEITGKNGVLLGYEFTT
jgi:hypothetical protein